MSEEKKIVVQSNKLIEAHYKQQYTVHEQKMLLWLLSEIHAEDHFNKHSTKHYKEKKITISAQKYADLVAINIDDIYKRAKEIGEGLMQKVIKVEENKGWKMFHWLSYMKYSNGIIEVAISADILPYILDLKEKFTAFNLKNVLYLRSTHTIKLYQILVQYKKIGIRIVLVNDLKELLGIAGEKTYILYGKVKEKILEPSKREINAKTDINIDFKEIKTGKKVTSLEFTITPKKGHQPLPPKRTKERNVVAPPSKKRTPEEKQKLGEHLAMLRGAVTTKDPF